MKGFILFLLWLGATILFWLWNPFAGMSPVAILVVVLLAFVWVSDLNRKDEREKERQKLLAEIKAMIDDDDDDDDDD